MLGPTHASNCGSEHSVLGHSVLCHGGPGLQEALKGPVGILKL